MWQYQNTDELYHHGVLGMKWGHRKAMYQTINTAKRNRKLRDQQIQSQYDKAERSIEKSYKRGQKLSVRDQKRELVADTRAQNAWAKSKAQYKQEKAAAKANYKSTIKKRKESIKSNYKDIQSKSKLGDRIVYNNATRKLAAKYMTDNKMSMADARKKANKVAWRNTAVAAAASLGYMGYVYKKYKV